VKLDNEEYNEGDTVDTYVRIENSFPNISGWYRNGGIDMGHEEVGCGCGAYTVAGKNNSKCMNESRLKTKYQEYTMELAQQQ
jgi:hypothetical protein